MRGDREKVQQILVNLLFSAVKFTAPGGSVTLTCSVTPSLTRSVTSSIADATAAAVTLRVTDDGRGIPTDHLERIFEPFVQGDAKLTRAQGETGLGSQSAVTWRAACVAISQPKVPWESAAHSR